ncbi:MAG: adenosine kinase [Alphaproteobacteria bacterium]|nr:adenosine kinase [Alphaproteobacteria bacterium]
MTEPTLDVIGIGNAIVDVLSNSEDAFLVGHGLQKGAMTLIDAARAEALYDAMGAGIECSGGSAANTIAGIASLGGTAGFVGKVRDDALGRIFAHDMRALGVRFATPPSDAGAATARCLIFVTPDAQRTMQTYLGACLELTPDDIVEEEIAAGHILYLEGYLWDPPRAKEAFRKAMKIAHAHGRLVALTLSDAFCVERHREEFRELVENHVDILFANEQEILSLYQVRDFDAALQQVRQLPGVTALTRSAKGSVVVSGEEIHIVDADPVARVVDTTGAGDLYAAGFLYGMSQGLPLRTCARIGGLAAAEVIGHVGARPQVPLARLLAEKLAIRA